MRIKLAWSQTCVLFPFTTAGPPLFPETKKNQQQPIYWVLLLAGGRHREAGIDHFQRLFCFGVWLHLSVETHCTTELWFYTRGNKTNVKSKRSVQHASAVFDVCSQTPSLCSRWNMTYYSVFFSFRWVQGHRVIESASTRTSRRSG